MFRQLYVLHRWFGIGGGVMVLVWCVSGVGIHWRALPRVLAPHEQRLIAGHAFAPSQATKPFREILAVAGVDAVREIRLRRAGSRLVYDVRGDDGIARILDAQTGASIGPISDSFAREIARTYLPAAAVRESVVLTRGDRFSSNLPMPLYRVTFDDPHQTNVYVSGTTASVLARARTPERSYFTFASIPHFLTFNTPWVRQHDTLRHAALFVLNTCALLIVATGAGVIVVMIWRRGFLSGIGHRDFLIRKWHYLVGLGFSVSTLLFVLSGFFLVMDGGTPPEAVLATPTELRRISPVLSTARTGILNLTDAMILAGNGASARVTDVTLKLILEMPVYAFRDAHGRQLAIRADTGGPIVVDQDRARRMAHGFLGRPVNIGNLDYLTDYDDYYYARDQRFPPLPVYRVACDDAHETVLYLSAATGEVVGRTDRRFRLRRWLVIGPHTWDFPFLLNRPRLRDAVVVTQMAGGVTLTVTGLYLGATHGGVWWRRRRGARRGPS